MSLKNKLSVIIIAKNEQAMIEDCLKSVEGFADEIILVDTGSTDKTIEIGKKYGAEVFEEKGQEVNFSAWRNRGLKEAAGDWVLYLDADERLTPPLRKEIKTVIQKGGPLAYEIPRQNYYLGRKMRYGGAWPDYVKRLYPEKGLRGWHKKLHEDPVFEGGFGRLKEPLIHLTHRDLTSMLQKTDQWSRIEAELLFKDYPGGHPPVTWWRILRMMWSEFWQRGVKLQGLRDGTVGWIEVIFQMFSRFITYARLWELQCRKQKNPDSIK